MTLCEAFKWHGSWRACWDCGHPYWTHSHEYTLTGTHWAGGRIKHTIITREQANTKWAQHAVHRDQWKGMTPETTPDADPDLRPRYQIMQERRVSISKFYLTAAQLHKHRQGDRTRRTLQETTP